MKNIVCDIGIYNSSLTDDEIIHLVNVGAIYWCKAPHTLGNYGLTQRIFHLSSENRDPSTYFLLALTDFRRQRNAADNSLNGKDLINDSRFHKSEVEPALGSEDF